MDPEEAAKALAKMQAQMKAGTDFVPAEGAAAAPGGFVSGAGGGAMPMLFDVNAKRRKKPAAPASAASAAATPGGFAKPGAFGTGRG